MRRLFNTLDDADKRAYYGMAVNMLYGSASSAPWITDRMLPSESLEPDDDSNWVYDAKGYFVDPYEGIIIYEGCILDDVSIDEQVINLHKQLSKINSLMSEGVVRNDCNLEVMLLTGIDIDNQRYAIINNSFVEDVNTHSTYLDEIDDLSDRTKIENVAIYIYHIEESVNEILTMSTGYEEREFVTKTMF